MHMALSHDRIVGPKVVAAELEESQGRVEDHLLATVGGLFRDLVEMGRWAADVDWSKRLKREGWIKTPAITSAFKKIRRYDFLPTFTKSRCGFNSPQPIGYEQTNSQPSVVAMMLEHLQPKKDQKILDIGSGSGWTTALLAAIVGSEGKVIGTERIPELVKMGQANISAYKGLEHAEIRQAAEALGCPEEGPFDRILVSAATLSDKIPELIAQLSEQGILVAPIKVDSDPKNQKTDLCVIVPDTDAEAGYKITSTQDGFEFVPLLEVHASNGHERSATPDVG